MREKWLEQDICGKVTDKAYEDGESVVYCESMFTWVDQYTAASSYVVGFIVTDLDVTRYPVYSQIEVQ